MCPRHARAVAALLLANATAMAAADSLRVARPVARHAEGFVLEVRLDDPRRLAPEGAWVAVGQDRGLRDERTLGLRLLLDVAGVTLAPDLKAARLGFLTLARDPRDAAGVVQLSLERVQAAWQVVPRAWDDTQGAFVPLGQAPLALDEAASRGVTLELEWRAASAPGARDGAFSLYRRAAPAAGPRTLLVRREDLDNGAQAIGHVRLGVAAREHSPGVAGVLRLDALELYRGAPPAAQPGH